MTVQVNHIYKDVVTLTDGDLILHVDKSEVQKHADLIDESEEELIKELLWTFVCVFLAGMALGIAACEVGLF
jgi:hypothetical protein